MTLLQEEGPLNQDFLIAKESSKHNACSRSLQVALLGVYTVLLESVSQESLE